MTMTAEEIVRHYRQAKSKPLDIQILADLNAVSEEEIVNVLVEAGYIKNRKRMKRTPRQQEIEKRGKEVRRMLRLGYGYDEIRRKVNCGDNTVWKHAQELSRMSKEDEGRRHKRIMEAIRIIDKVPEDAPMELKIKAFNKCKETLKKAEE